VHIFRKSIAANKRPTQLRPGYFPTQPEAIFLDMKGKKLKNFTFLGENFQILTQTINGWPDPTRATKKLTLPGSKIFDPYPSLWLYMSDIPFRKKGIFKCKQNEGGEKTLIELSEVRFLGMKPKFQRNKNQTDSPLFGKPKLSFWEFLLMAKDSFWTCKIVLFYTEANQLVEEVWDKYKYFVVIISIYFHLK